MVVLGPLLLAAGVVAILAAVFSTSGTASFLGADLGAGTLFFLGVAATLAVLCGAVLTRAGTGRALRHRREHRREHRRLRHLERARGGADSGGPDGRGPEAQGDLDETRDDL